MANTFGSEKEVNFATLFCLLFVSALAHKFFNRFLWLLVDWKVSPGSKKRSKLGAQKDFGAYLRKALNIGNFNADNAEHSLYP